MKPILTAIVPCMGRLHHLQESIPALLRQPGIETILVDYSCPDGSVAHARIHWPGLRVVEVPGQRYFNKCHALNVGARAVRTPWLAIIDADSVVCDGFASAILPLLADDVFLIYPFVAGGVGFLICTAQAFWDSGAFDERMRGWGAEDVDLRRRLMDMGLKPVIVPRDLVRMILHPKEESVRHYEIQDAITSQRANLARLSRRLELEDFDPWSDGTVFAILGPGVGEVWKALQYCHYVRRRHRADVKLAARWHGEDGQTRDRGPLAHALQELLDGQPRIEIVSEAVEKIVGLTDRSPWHFPRLPASRRWQAWANGPRRRIACQLADRNGVAFLSPEEQQRLKDSLPGIEVIAVEETMPLADLIATLTQCDLLLGRDGGLMQLAYSLGVPVFQSLASLERLDRLDWHGDQSAIHCQDLDDVVFKLTMFLGLSSTIHDEAAAWRRS